MATIVDVAKLAGVSIKTVSRVMNNHAYVRDDTRERVEQAMKSLEYRPSEAAQLMRTGKSKLIGMLYGAPSSGYQARLNHAMLQACSDAGTYLAAGIFDELGGAWKEQLEAFLERTRIDKMILVPPMCDSSVLQEVLVQRGVDFVLLSPSRSTLNAPSVVMDDRSAAREITQYLLGLGHKKIGHLAGEVSHVASLLRRQGYEEALMEAGSPKPIDGYIAEGRFDFKQSLAVATQILSLEDRPTAIFAANDDMAAAVVVAAGNLGLSVPGDLSVVGFDDTPIAETIWPTLTTIAQPFEEMAVAAVGMLNRSGAEVHQERSLLKMTPHTLIVRESCAPLI